MANNAEASAGAWRGARQGRRRSMRGSRDATLAALALALTFTATACATAHRRGPGPCAKLMAQYDRDRHAAEADCSAAHPGRESFLACMEEKGFPVGRPRACVE